MAALKILPRELAADPAFAERFMREGRALAKLSHPNIVGVFDFGKSGDFHWLLMEYVDGVNLRQAMHAGAMNPRETLQVIPAICAALDYSHSQGVLHRDIKPENILIDTSGRVKIADFGVAKLSGEAGRRVTLTLSGSPLGTPAYMAPEQIEHPQDVDHRADIYSLGVVFYEMLTGELPLGRFPAPSETAGIDPRLDTVVFRTLEKQRERRYQSAGEMKTQVENVASAPPLPCIPPQIPRMPGRVPERTSRKAVWGLVLVLLGMLVLLVALPMAYMNLRREEVQIRAEQMHHELERNRNAQPASPAAGAKPDTKLAGELVRKPAEALILIITGMVLGFSALRDIRLAGGRLGGAVAATFAAGWTPRKWSKRKWDISSPRWGEGADRESWIVELLNRYHVLPDPRSPISDSRFSDSRC